LWRKKNETPEKGTSILVKKGIIIWKKLFIHSREGNEVCSASKKAKAGEDRKEEGGEGGR